MTVTSVTSEDYSNAILESRSGSSSSSSSSTSSAEDIYTTWIAILAAQLQNQDPTDPVDPSEFTGQLTSIASLEQQALTNDTLNDLIDSVQGIESGSVLGYLGAEITAVGDTTPLSNGDAEWQYALGSDADEVIIKVLDTDGNVVYTTTGETSSGTHDFTWDGTTDDGGTAPDGAYQLVVEAVDSAGDDVSTAIYAKGTVTSVITTTSPPLLLMDDVAVPTSYVTAIAAQ